MKLNFKKSKTRRSVRAHWRCSRTERIPPLIPALLCIALLFNGKTYAQFGDGRDGPLDIFPGQTETINTVKTPVTSHVRTGGTSTAYTVNSTTGFVQNDYVLVIQMVGGIIGTYSGGVITNVSGTDITVDHASGTTKFPAFSYPDLFNPHRRVQMIKVPQYTDVTLYASSSATNIAKLTAPAFDNYTGGVLCMFVSGTLEFRSGNYPGLITMAEKGYVNIGTGGAGGAAENGGNGYAGGAAGTGSNPNGGNGGGTAQSGQAGYLAWAICTGLTGGTGGTGGGQNTFGSPGNPGANNSFTFSGTNAIGQSMRMGNAGSGGDGGMGGGAGRGGGGGGYSIGGGATAGQDGVEGRPGGNGGDGAKGGGIIYIRAANINVQNGCTTCVNKVVFSAKGQNGEDGDVADGDLIAGQGGAGGNGGLGGCNSGTAMSAGGAGTGGYRGNGAGGGNGGNGGDAGPVFLVVGSSPSGTLPTGTNVDVTGGTAGQGGAGARPYPTKASDGTSTIYDLAGCGYPTVYYCDQEIVNNHPCQCWEAFDILAATNSAATVGSELQFSSGGYKTAVYDMSGSRQLRSKDYGGTSARTSVSPQMVYWEQYFCELAPNSACDNLFNDIAATTGGTQTTKPNNIPFNAGSTYTESTTPKKLFDANDQCGVTCSPDCSNSDCPQEGADGMDGTAGLSSVFQVATDNEAGWSAGSFAPVYVGPAKDSLSSPEVDYIALYPQPAADVLNFRFAAVQETNAMIIVFDMKGRRMMRRQFSAKEGSNEVSLDVSGLKSGSYLLSVSAGKQEIRKTFIVKQQ